MSTRFRPIGSPTRLVFAIVFLGTTCLQAPTAADNGMAPIAQGTKAMGRGGARTAVADDAMSVTANPALITELPPLRVDVTLAFYGQRSTKRDPFGSDHESSFDGVPWPTLAVVFDPVRKARDFDLISYSAAPEDGAEEGFSYGGEAGDTRIAFSIQQPYRLMIAPTFTGAVRLGRNLSVGLSVGVPLTYLEFDAGGGIGGGSSGAAFVPAGTLTVHRQADGTPVDPPQPFFAGTGSQVTWAELFDLATQPSGPPTPPDPNVEPEPLVRVENVFGAGIMGQLGLLWTPRGDLSVGVSLRPPGMIFNPTGTGKVDLTPALRDLENNSAVGQLVGPLIETYLPNGGSQGLSSDYEVELDSILLPAELSFGIAWWPISRWMLSLDVRYIFWDSSLDTLEVKAKGGTNADLNEIGGGPNVTYRVLFDWKDQYVIALGTTFGVTDWLVLRAGFNHGNNPVPSRTSSATPFVIENHVTFGFSLYPGNWDIDFAYVYGLPQSVRKAPDASFAVEEHVVVFGVGYTF